LPGKVPGRRVAAAWVSHLDAWRITLTPEAILDSRAIVMLVAGSNKAAAVYAALRAPLDVQTYPAQLLRAADRRVEWFVDRAAAARL
jgi:6-phosphogluconolactonase/glucosamine-6-phosphate isomerase/deaminase